jgi:nitrite reductase/ring-hydroxylating ferredoxin subunit/uncharacterized membrane protein
MKRRDEGMAAEESVDFLERQSWLEPVESGLQKGVARAFAGAGSTGREIQNVLHGTWLGHPLHAILTDIPLGSWTATLVLDLLEAAGRRDCKAGADVTLQVGLAGAACAALAGLTDWHVTDGRARRVGLVHGALNIIGAGLYTASLISRKRRERSAGRAYAFAGFLVAAASSYLGGNLVYGKQIGVNRTTGYPEIDNWTPAIAEAELMEGVPRRVTIGGARLLLIRREGNVHCIGEVCSHMGGPLAEGKIDGDTVTCPWHGSCFSLRDGSVIDGPATHPQPCFETRLNAGEIEVRSPRG